MIEPDEKVLRSMLHLKVDEKANPFIEWLQTNLDTGRKSTDQLAMTEQDFRQIQGGNVCLDTILKKIEQSHESLSNLYKNRENDSAAGKAL